MTYDLSTAVAHHAWDQRWAKPEDEPRWAVADAGVAEVADGLLKDGGARRVLDLGCGIGRHALMFARAGYEVTALDGAPAGLAAVRAAAAEEGLAVKVDEGLMTDLPYEDGSFDYVLAFNVIYHGEPGVVRRSIAEIHRVLAPRGLYQGTMLSKRNEKYGVGEQVAPDTFMKGDTGETAHPHYYCSAGELCALFEGFELLRLEDQLHRKPGSWHWHMLAERTS